MSYKIYVTSFFEKDIKHLAKKYPSMKKDLGRLIPLIEADPFTGKALGKDCFKIRMAITSKGKGKSGGSESNYFSKSGSGKCFPAIHF